MKNLSFILTFIILSSCIDSKKDIQQKSKVELELVDEIFIKKELYGTDSIRLNEQQTELFVTEWNNAKSEGLHKMRPEFWIILKLKNDSVRKFRTNKNLIKEKNDWTYSLSDSILISLLYKPKYSVARPENYDPISFLKKVTSTLRADKDSLYIGMNMIGNFPIDWVKEEHIEYLIESLESDEACGCYLNPLSSELPIGKFAEKGGFAGVFIKAFKEKRRVQLGLYSCPKVDDKLNSELKKWWEENKPVANNK